jgi:hypothetical protein
MSKSTKDKAIKITADYIIDEYLAAKKLKGNKRNSAMAHVVFLSKNLNKFIHIKDQCTQ